jgi:hypothetical protein
MPRIQLLAILASTHWLASACTMPRDNEAPPATRAVSSVRQEPSVWVNTSSGVYHCPTSTHCGNTRDGEYMTEPTAMAAGYRPARDTGCNDERDGVKVWVNTASGVYHCPRTRWYGATADGRFELESEARAHGYEPANGTECGG